MQCLDFEAPGNTMSNNLYRRAVETQWLIDWPLLSIFLFIFLNQEGSFRFKLIASVVFCSRWFGVCDSRTEAKMKWVYLLPNNWTSSFDDIEVFFSLCSFPSSAFLQNNVFICKLLNRGVSASTRSKKRERKKEKEVKGNPVCACNSRMMWIQRRKSYAWAALEIRWEQWLCTLLPFWLHRANQKTRRSLCIWPQMLTVVLSGVLEHLSVIWICIRLTFYHLTPSNKPYEQTEWLLF